MNAPVSQPQSAALPRLAVLPVLALALAACGPQAERLVLHGPPNGTLSSVGQTFTVEVEAFDKAGKPVKPPELRWASSDPGVASVEDGVVVARRSGLVKLIAARGQLRAELPLQVAVATSVDFSPGGLELLAVGQTVNLTASVRNEKGKPLSWLEPELGVEDEGVVQLKDGKLVAVGPGKTRVVASWGALKRALPVQVVAVPVALVQVTPVRLVLERPGQSARVVAVALDARGAPVAGVPFSYFSSDPSAAVVDREGRVTAVRPGRTIVSVTAGRRVAASEVVVQARPVVRR